VTGHRLDRAVFEACRPSLRPRRARRWRLRGSPALLSGRLFDNRGNRMSPTHANKRGARYRYYVSQAVLQNKPPPSGLVGRVPAAEIEALVVAALRVRRYLWRGVRNANYRGDTTFAVRDDRGAESGLDPRDL